MGSQSTLCELVPLRTQEVSFRYSTLLDRHVQCLIVTGHASPIQHHANIMPRIKKPNAYPIDVKKYWPISNLTFASKLIERLVCRQLMAFLDQEYLLPVHQSAYGKYHSTQTIILKIVSDVLLATDHGAITLLGLLDLSTIFDMIDHDIPIECFHASFGVHRSALAWINSFICDRTQTVVSTGSGRLIRHWLSVFLKEVGLDQYFTFSTQPASLQSQSVMDLVHIHMQMTLNCMHILNLHPSMTGELA